MTLRLLILEEDYDRLGGHMSSLIDFPGHAWRWQGKVEVDGKVYVRMLCYRKDGQDGH